MEGEQAPVQVGQFILGKNLGIGAFGKVSIMVLIDLRSFALTPLHDLSVLGNFCVMHFGEE
jgi:hypothetical protein